MSVSFHDQIRFLRIIFFILLTAQLVFFIIAFALRESFIPDPAIISIFDYLIPVVLFASIFLSRFLYKNIVFKSRGLSLSEKIQSYRTASLVSLAVLEGANITSITAFMLTGEYLYAAASVILFLLFMLNIPSEDKFRLDLELKPEEF
jgi:hypothetical protein